MRVALIGAGNVATHLGVALQRAGHEVLQVFSRTEASASELADRISVPFTVSLADVCRDADIYIVSVKDAVLEEVAAALVKGREEALFLHTAGSMPMSVWEGRARHYGVLYPMQTFSKCRELDFSLIPCFIEANGEQELRMLRALAESLSRNVREATSEQRKYLHLAAVFTCNFANHMYALGAQLLEAHGLSFNAMLPLVDETARKVRELSPREAQTGPAIRYDENVIGKHLALLADNPPMQELYEKISRSIHELK